MATARVPTGAMSLTTVQMWCVVCVGVGLVDEKEIGWTDKGTYTFVYYGPHWGQSATLKYIDLIT